MSRYGEAAVKAERKRLPGKKLTPVEAWEWAINQSSLSDSSKKKCCPKLAYVGLCESKKVVSSEKSKNKRYAREAVRILRKTRPSSAAALWRQVTANLKCKGLTHNGQMDVVLALKDAGYI